jgi:hypothetical protein
VRLVVLSCLVATLFATPLGRPNQLTELSHRKETIWFELQANPQKEFGIEPIAKVSEGKLLPIPNGCRDKDPGYEAFRKNYATPGRSYNVFFRGRPAGRVSILNAEENFAPFPVKYEGLAPLDKETAALATNATGHRSGGSSRHSPMAAERLEAINIARKIFLRAGVAPKLSAVMKVENLTRTILSPSDHPSLIGSFSIPLDNDESGIVHNLFFIATANGSGYVTEFSSIHISRGETDNEAMQFIDQADLRSDGKNAIVVGLTLYENYFYRIYERMKRSSGWEQVFSAEAPGCD